jgi:dTMP kinase
MKGKLIVIEGTDCSGKETQTARLIVRLQGDGRSVMKFDFPHYESPTGKIVGGPYLGKKHIGKGFFKEGAANVDPKVASLYFAADRKYNLPIIIKALNEGKVVIIDRWVDSNTAHQGGKIFDKKEREKFYKFINNLEYKLLGLPKADIRIFLHVPYQFAEQLKSGRKEAADQHEMSKEHLINAEKAYLEVCELHDYKRIECVKDEKLRSIEDINDEIYNHVKEQLTI